MYKVIKILLAVKERLGKLVEKLREYSIKRLEGRIHLAAERTDVEEELYLQRLKFAEATAKLLEERAEQKLSEGLASANEAKKVASKEIEQLKKL